MLNPFLLVNNYNCWTVKAWRKNGWCKKMIVQSVGKFIVFKFFHCWKCWILPSFNSSPLLKAREIFTFYMFIAELLLPYVVETVGKFHFIPIHCRILITIHCWNRGKIKTMLTYFLFPDNYNCWIITGVKRILDVIISIVESVGKFHLLTLCIYPTLQICNIPKANVTYRITYKTQFIDPIFL